MIVYVIRFETGWYDDASETHCCGFTDEVKAKAFTDAFNAYLFSQGAHTEQNPLRSFSLTFQGKDYNVDWHGADVSYYELQVDVPFTS